MTTATAREFPSHCCRARINPTTPGIWLHTRYGLDCLVEIGPRGGIRRWWRRVDRRETSVMPVSTWDRTQAAARGR
jgi:hypothetical protein